VILLDFSCFLFVINGEYFNSHQVTKWVSVKQQKKQQQLQHNALAPQKKECDARRRQPIQMDDAICINQVK
jgi:hypothetical protein